MHRCRKTGKTHSAGYTGATSEMHNMCELCDAAGAPHLQTAATQSRSHFEYAILTQKGRRRLFSRYSFTIAACVVSLSSGLASLLLTIKNEWPAFDAFLFGILHISAHYAHNLKLLFFILWVYTSCIAGASFWTSLFTHAPRGECLQYGAAVHFRFNNDPDCGIDTDAAPVLATPNVAQSQSFANATRAVTPASPHQNAAAIAITAANALTPSIGEKVPYTSFLHATLFTAAAADATFLLLSLVYWQDVYASLFIWLQYYSPRLWVFIMLLVSALLTLLIQFRSPSRLVSSTYSRYCCRSSPYPSSSDWQSLPAVDSGCISSAEACNNAQRSNTGQEGNIISNRTGWLHTSYWGSVYSGIKGEGSLCAINVLEHESCNCTTRSRNKCSSEDEGGSFPSFRAGGYTELTTLVNDSIFVPAADSTLLHSTVAETDTDCCVPLRGKVQRDSKQQQVEEHRLEGERRKHEQQRKWEPHNQHACSFCVCGSHSAFPCKKLIYHSASHISCRTTFLILVGVCWLFLLAAPFTQLILISPCILYKRPILLHRNGLTGEFQSAPFGKPAAIAANALTHKSEGIAGELTAKLWRGKEAAGTDLKMAPDSRTDESFFEAAMKSNSRQSQFGLHAVSDDDTTSSSTIAVAAAIYSAILEPVKKIFSEAATETLSLLPAKPLLIGHRGVPALRPENTESSFDLAADHCTGYESDVEISTDGVPFLMHDVTAYRTTDVQEKYPEAAHRRVDSFDFTTLQTLNAGSWWLRTDPFETKASLASSVLQRIAQQKIPTLKWFLQKGVSTDKKVIFDIRCPPCASNDKKECEDACLGGILQVMRETNSGSRVLWLHGKRELVKREFKDVVIVASVGNGSFDPTTEDNNLVQMLNADYHHFDAAAVRKWAAAGYWVNVYVVSEPWLLAYYWCAGAHSVTTDNCTLLKELGAPPDAYSRSEFMTFAALLDFFCILLVLLSLWYQRRKNL